MKMFFIELKKVNITPNSLQIPHFYIEKVKILYIYIFIYRERERWSPTYSNGCLTLSFPTSIKPQSSSPIITVTPSKNEGSSPHTFFLTLFYSFVYDYIFAPLCFQTSSLFVRVEDENISLGQFFEF
jgi:hypothetical protein